METQSTFFQIALFVNNLGNELNVKETFASNLTTLFNFKKTESNILPIPNEAPPEILRIRLNNTSTSEQIDVFGNKIDFTAVHYAQFDSLKTDKNNVIEIARKLQKISEEKKLIIFRIGLIIGTKLVLPSNVKASKVIESAHLKNEEIISRTKELRIEFTKTKKIGKIDSFVLLRTEPNGSGLSLQENVLSLMIDVNTQPMAKQSNYTSVISSYCKEAFPIALSTLEQFITKYESDIK